MISLSYLNIKLSKQGVNDCYSIEIIYPDIFSLLLTKLLIPFPLLAQFYIK